MSSPIDIVPPAVPNPSPAPVHPSEKRRSRVSAGLVLLALGLALIAAAAFIDAREAKHAPWSGALFSPNGEPPWEGALHIRARRLSLQNYPLREEIQRTLMETLPPEELEVFGLDRTDWLIVVYAPVSTLEPLLASGRMPRPGYPEVLAGAFADRGDIYADDAHFAVVGRLSRTAGGLATAYVMPADDVWEPLFERTMTWGWLDPNGLDKLAAMKEDSPIHERAEVFGGHFPASALSVWCTMAGLALAAAGGSVLHRIVFQRIRTGMFGTACRAFEASPKLVRVMHLLLYGGFFASAVFTILNPQINIIAMNFITHAFSEGSLNYVGDAYRSGNVFMAALATWVNNYLLQTVVLTMLLSLAIPYAGILKTFASFAFAGLGMAPLWSGIAANYTFHSITMVLELEAYIYACVAVAIFWIKLYAALRQRNSAPVLEGTRIMASATLLAGVQLAIAGLYEALTLILLR